MARRQYVAFMLVTFTIVLGTIFFFSSGTSDSSFSVDLGAKSELRAVPLDILNGGSISPKLDNATAKAELGRASWKLIHTMMARFPEEPTADDQLALQTFIKLFARLYPCGECAAHFRKLLKKYPPQVKNRNAAAGWACFVHNEVNKKLKKDQFDCNKIGDFYDCGCGEEDKKKGTGKVAAEELRAGRADLGERGVSGERRVDYYG